LISIAVDWLRVEYSGVTPAKVVVPLVFPPGKYTDVRVRVEPRDSVRLGQSAETGDALQQVFTTGQSGTIGGSFFGSVSYSRLKSTASPQFSVSMTSDFRGVIFFLPKFKSEDSQRILIAFPIESYTANPAATFFARVVLEVAGVEVEQCEVPPEVHPRAATVLVVDDFINRLSGHKKIRLPAGPFVTFGKGIYEPRSSTELISAIAEGWPIVHIASDVDRDAILFHNFQIPIGELLDAMDHGQTRLIFLSSCNSVQIVNKFRQSGVDALIAATDNLVINYANIFEWEFYNALSLGESVSESFIIAKRKAGSSKHVPSIRSSITHYNPMFLEIKEDVTFRPTH
jgi:hypothetical protein